MNRHAFTLIELMIAVALGMLIVYVALAGFRVAAQSITVTNRLALENDLLRSACIAANERLDFWTDYDDPDNLAEQRLRPRDATGGLPFTPISDVFPLVRHASDPEKSNGWDPQEQWKAADSRSWWHGNVAEKFNSEMALGRYSIFGNSRPPVLVIGLPLTVVGGIGEYGTVSVPHEWYYRQVWGLHNAMGYYAFAEYLPQNTLFACYQDFQRASPMWPERETNQDGMPVLLFRPGTSFDNGEGGQEYPKGLWRLTMVSSYGLVSPTSPNANQSVVHRNRYLTGYWNNQNEMRRFHRETENRRTFLDGPGHWPTAQITTQHFIKTGRFVNYASIRLQNPVTGGTTELAFTAFSTTLRGARLQRRHPSQGGGWADHDNGVAVVNHLTLDDTP